MRTLASLPRVSIAIALLGLCVPAAAQKDYPNRPMRFIVANAPGGSNSFERIRGLRSFRDKLAAQGVEPLIMNTQQFAAYVNEEVARWAQVVKEANLEID